MGTAQLGLTKKKPGFLQNCMCDTNHLTRIAMSNAVGELAILRLIQSRAATSQIEMARALGLPTNTVHGMVKRIEAQGLIFEQRQEIAGRGRPSVHYGIRMPGRVLVMKWLGTEWFGIIMGEEGVDESQIAHFSSPTVPNVRAAAAHFIRIRDLALRNSTARLKDLDGAILMLNAQKLPDDGSLTSSVIPWVGEITEPFLTRTLGCKALISNHPHSAELELRSWTREGVRSLVVFNVGDGVSAHYANLAGPWAQSENLPGEVGHIERQSGGEICGCGSRGCLETLIAGSWMLRRVLKDIANGVQTCLVDSLAKPPQEFFKDLDLAAGKGKDQYAQKLLEEFIDHCAWGISVAVNMFQPALIVVEGYAFNERWHWVDRIAEALPTRAIPIENLTLRLEPSRQQSMDMMRELATEFFLLREGITV